MTVRNEKEDTMPTFIDEVIQKVGANDKEEMQKFVDAYMCGGDKFWDKEYEYSAFTLGRIITECAKECSKFVGFTRKVMAGRVVRSGEVVRYDKDVHTIAYCVEDHGNVISVGDTQYVYPPAFEVSFALEFPEEVVNGSKFFQDVCQQALKQLVMIQDSFLFKLLNHVTRRTTIPESNNFAEMFQRVIFDIEKRRFPVDNILLNKDTADHFVAEAVKHEKTNLIDPMHQKELVETGYIGNNGHAMLITKANIIDADPIPKDTVYALAASQYIGGAPVQVDLMAEPVNQRKNGKWAKGLFFYKLMSMVIINPFTVARGKLTGYDLF